MAYKQNTPEQNKKFFDGMDYAVWIKLAYDKQLSDEELIYLKNLDGGATAALPELEISGEGALDTMRHKF